MEKIKNDFAKYTNRLFELPDVSDQSALVSFIQGIQQFLWAHLNLVTEIWDSSLKTAYEKRKQHSWEPFSYFSSIIEYGKMFWSFGALEYAATIFDDLEQFLNDFGCKSGEQNSPRWIPQLLNTKLEDRPSLIASFSVQKFQKNEAHYLGMMNYLLCQQILMAIHLYQNKMKSLDAAPSLRSDCVFLIMKKSLATIESVKEFNNVMNSNSSTDELLSLILFISRCENGESSELNDLFAKKCKQKAEESGSPVE
uniref:TRAPPC10/Trs130 N-terminal domain-containing protein n=1 Tax=Caenorhabditis japonica TaxID=281687 RepID=A0A8R1DY08_CAEJA